MVAAAGDRGGQVGAHRPELLRLTNLFGAAAAAPDHAGSVVLCATVHARPAQV
jgi:hypothetical protein